VCLIAVVDNSGSIHPGLEQIRDALEKLNDARKPGDELGLVVFGTHQEVDIWQNPSPDPLDTVGVDASGRMTALWDGVVEGLEAADSCSADNRYLLLLTDGHDTDSQRLGGDSETQAREVARRAREQGVNICTVCDWPRMDVGITRLRTSMSWRLCSPVCLATYVSSIVCE
jgi:Mg-chelatase subunit ChlD